MFGLVFITPVQEICKAKKHPKKNCFRWKSCFCCDYFCPHPHSSTCPWHTEGLDHSSHHFLFLAPVTGCTHNKQLTRMCEMSRRLNISYDDKQLRPRSRNHLIRVYFVFVAFKQADNLKCCSFIYFRWLLHAYAIIQPPHKQGIQIDFCKS